MQSQKPEPGWDSNCSSISQAPLDGLGIAETVVNYRLVSSCRVFTLAGNSLCRAVHYLVKGVFWGAYVGVVGEFLCIATMESVRITSIAGLASIAGVGFPAA